MTEDDFEEGDETIIVNGRATGGLTVAPAILTVRDNDRHDIKLTANRYTIRENEVAARVTPYGDPQRHEWRSYDNRCVASGRYGNSGRAWRSQ